jgi:hypothetical protein
MEFWANLNNYSNWQNDAIGIISSSYLSDAKALEQRNESVWTPVSPSE